MPARWSRDLEFQKRKELIRLYVAENKTIGEIGEILGISFNTVYDRLIRLGIQSRPERKAHYRNKKFVTLPRKSLLLAEFMGIMFGDGHRANGQLIITINSRDDSEYITYVSGLIHTLFNRHPGIFYRPAYNTADVYLGSVDAIRYLSGLGLTSSNKVKDQIGAPQWILKKHKYYSSFIRGFFDTDGSLYRLSSGRVQMSFVNKSKPLLKCVRVMLKRLGFHPSRMTHVLYLTRREDLQKYISVIGFSNHKHIRRLKQFGYTILPMGGSHSGNCS